METLQKIALVLLIIGGINWGLVGLFDLNIVTSIFGDKTLLEKIIYLIIAISSIISISTLFAHFEQKKTAE